MLNESDIIELIEQELSEFSPYNIAGAVSIDATIVIPVELPDGWSSSDGIDEVTAHITKEFVL